MQNSIEPCPRKINRGGPALKPIFSKGTDFSNGIQEHLPSLVIALFFSSNSLRSTTFQFILHRLRELPYSVSHPNLHETAQQ